MELQDYYLQENKHLKELTFRGIETQSTFFRHLLLVVSSIFGIIISLQNNNAEPLYIRLTFFPAMVSLIVNILLLSLIVYDYTRSLSQVYQGYRIELLKAQQEKRYMNPTKIRKEARTRRLEKYTYICLGISLFLLFVYSTLICFL